MNTTSIIQKKRLATEKKKLKESPLHYITAYPDETNPLIWYFLLIGQKGTDYHGGEYIGKILHGAKYPLEPPDYVMLTPSGRYDVGKKICLSNSGFHRGEWNSSWNIINILIGFYMIWTDDKEHGIAHIHDTPENRKKMAMDSINFNKYKYNEIYSKFDRTFLCDDEPKKVVNNAEKPCSQINTLQSSDETIDTKPSAIDTDESVIDTKPSAIDTKPSTVDTKPSTVDTEPPAVDTKMHENPPIAQSNQKIIIEHEEPNEDDNDKKKVVKAKKVRKSTKKNINK